MAQQLTLTPTEIEGMKEAAGLMDQLKRVRGESKLHLLWQKTADEGHQGGPYKWQCEFLAAGALHPERCLMAANRVGKSEIATGEIAIHATGLYPHWWEGRRFRSPVRIWVGSETSEASRDTVQRHLMGDSDNFGTGWIPKKLLHEKISMRRGSVEGVIDTCRIKHVTGGWSSMTFKSYEQGRAKWQGTSQHIVLFDEEPPISIFTEGITRTIDVKGFVMLTFTPLTGFSDTVQHFMDGGAGIFLMGATWDDAPHLDEVEKERLKNSYPEHERETRVSGQPMMGTGAVFTVKDDEIICDPFEVPPYYHRIAGCDFGIDHPAAGAWIAYDADRDVAYLYDCYRKSGTEPLWHANEFRARGDWIPVAWPADGLARDKGSGRVLMEMYRDSGANMLSLSARYNDDKGSNQPVEPGVLDMLERMKTGRLKVFSTCHQFLDEKRFYHRKDAKIVKRKDDIISAARYALMMLRYAVPSSRPTRQSVATMDYNPLAV